LFRGVEVGHKVPVQFHFIGAGFEAPDRTKIVSHPYLSGKVFGGVFKVDIVSELDSYLCLLPKMRIP